MAVRTEAEMHQVDYRRFPGNLPQSRGIGTGGCFQVGAIRRAWHRADREAAESLPVSSRGCE